MQISVIFALGGSEKSRHAVGAAALSLCENVSLDYYSSEPRNAMSPVQLQVMPMQLNIPSNVP